MQFAAGGGGEGGGKNRHLRGQDVSEISIWEGTSCFIARSGTSCFSLLSGTFGLDTWLRSPLSSLRRERGLSGDLCLVLYFSACVQQLSALSQRFGGPATGKELAILRT